MRRFELAEQTIEEACSALDGNSDAKPVAGGTALLTLIKQGVFTPKILVNLKKIPGVSSIEYNVESGLRIGALTSIYDVESSPLVRQHYPVLAEACHVVANIRIRNMGTIGGNLAHDDLRGPASYKRHLVGVLVRRALAAAIQKSKEAPPWH